MTLRCCACSGDKRFSLTSVFPRLRPFPFIKPEEPSAAFPGNCTMVSWIACKVQPCLMHGVTADCMDAFAWLAWGGELLQSCAHYKNRSYRTPCSRGLPAVVQSCELCCWQHHADLWLHHRFMTSLGPTRASARHALTSPPCTSASAMAPAFQHGTRLPPCSV